MFLTGKIRNFKVEREKCRIRAQKNVSKKLKFVCFSSAILTWNLSRINVCPFKTVIKTIKTVIRIRVFKVIFLLMIFMDVLPAFLDVIEIGFIIHAVNKIFWTTKIHQTMLTCASQMTSVV